MECLKLSKDPAMFAYEDLLLRRATNILIGKANVEAHSTIFKFTKKAKGITIITCSAGIVALTGVAIRYFSILSESK